jgi:hypothetical protein
MDNTEVYHNGGRNGFVQSQCKRPYAGQNSQCGITKGPYFRGGLAQRIEEGRGRELPGFHRYVDLWKGPTQDFAGHRCSTTRS